MGEGRRAAVLAWRGAHEPERRGFLSTRSFSRASLLPLEPFGRTGGGASRPPAPCGVLPEPELLCRMGMLELDDTCTCGCAGGGSIDPSSMSMSNCISDSSMFRFCGPGDLSGIGPAGDCIGTGPAGDLSGGGMAGDFRG